MAEKYTPVGWQGIIVETPADWSLVGISGDDKKGYFRIDSPIASALEMKWEQSLGKAPDLMVKAREFLSGIEKLLKKKKIKFTKELKADKDNPYSVRFSWRADRLGRGRLIYCEKCKRVIIAQLIMDRDENLSKVSSDILDSIRDHRDDDWVEWALYGFNFAVPPGYMLQKQKLMSPYIALPFKNGAKTLVVERWGLANTLLVKDDIETWYRKDAVPDIKDYSVKFENGEHLGHECLKIIGRSRGILPAIKKVAYSMTLHPYPELMTGYVWHCEESNRLISVRVTHVQGEDIAERVRDGILCHRRKSSVLSENKQ